MIDPKTIENYLNRIKEFPTLPTIYSSLVEVMSNPRSTAHDVANIIAQDQSAAAKVLKVANSSIYGFYGRINTITQAITYIGFDEVKNLVIALSIMNLFTDVKKNTIFNPINLWRHSLAVAVTTRIIGKTIGVKNIENFFVAGILHQIGKLFLYKIDETKYTEVVDYAIKNRVTLRDAENKVLGITYTVVGEMLAEKWNLPKTIITAIRYHNIGEADSSNNQMVAAIHLSKIFSMMVGFYTYKEELIIKPNDNIWEILGLPDNFFSSNIDVIVSSIKESESLLLKLK